MMGVMNVTPNSFSDGGEFNDSSSFKEQIKYLKSYQCKIFDLGAESTAPFNSAVNATTEIERLDPFLSLIKDEEVFSSGDTLSFDTYKIETIKYILSSLEKSDFKGNIIWNDVSGVIDDELLALLKTHDIKYVYSHNLVPGRSKTSDHMKYVQDELDLVSYFQKASLIFKRAGVMDRVIFDPCFGFAKSKKQNYELLATMNDWCLSRFNWLIGVSRKSFLQALSIEEDKTSKIAFSELIHTQLLTDWMRKYSRSEMIIRLHDPKVFHASRMLK